MNKEERNKKILAIVIVVAVLFLGIYKLFFERKDAGEKIDTKSIYVLNDSSRFYTVSSCVSKYLNYLTSSNTENLLTLLSNDYKTKNSITVNNIYSYVEKLNGTQTFSPKKMFEQRLSKSVYKYYVSGYIQQETMDSASNKRNYYLVVLLNEENMTFEIEPYDGSMFK